MSNAQVWIAASRPQTLLAAVSPVMIAAALASADGVFRWDAALVTLLGAVAIQIGANFANDVFDAENGADTSDRIGPPRVVAEGLLSPTAVKRATALVFGVAALAGLYLYTIAGWPILVIGIASIIAALTYVGGPRPYGYRGMGEVSVFVFFGLVATMGSRYAHNQFVDVKTLVAAVAIGLLVTALLVVNNIRDIETDRAADKRTLAVRMGRPATAKLYRYLIWGAFLIVGVGSWLQLLPTNAGLAVLTAPLAVKPIKIVTEEVAGPPLIEALKATARLQAIFATVLSLAIISAG